MPSISRLFRSKTTATIGLLGLTVLTMSAYPGSVQADPVVVENFRGLSAFDDAALNGGGFLFRRTRAVRIGPSHYVEMVNLVTAVYNKNGTIAQPRETLGTFFANAGVTGLDNNLSDPRVIYDQSSGRWFATAITIGTNSNNFVVAVSQTSDPTGAWKATQFRANNIANNFADYPTIAVDKNAFYVASNNYVGGTTFDGVSLTSIPKADLLAAGGPSAANKTLNENIVGGGTAGTTPATLAPVSSFGTRDHGVVISTDDFTPNSDLHRFNVLSPGTNSALVSVRGLRESLESVIGWVRNALELPEPLRFYRGADSRGALCGRRKTAPATTATSCAIRAT